MSETFKKSQMSEFFDVSAGCLQKSLVVGIQEIVLIEKHINGAFRLLRERVDSRCFWTMVFVGCLFSCWIGFLIS